jgi:NAD(P)-dependent dehydrogenase (short-subunit alcohol dehydrogenase family)
MASRTWFITGTSRGLGREWATAALRRGDQVAATARDTAALDDLGAEFGAALLTLALDVTDRDAVFAAVARAHAHFGTLDVVVNNAGYGQFGMVEEVTEADVRAQLETNFFGAVWVTQAALPFLRAQSSGHILQVSSIAGLISGPMLGIYNASKWALEGFSQSLAQEVAAFGIRVTLIEPGGFATDWGGASARHAERTAAYDGVYAAAIAGWSDPAFAPGDPAATAPAVLRIVDAEDPPLRALLGATALGIVEHDYEARLATWRDWQPVAALAQGVAS